MTGLSEVMWEETLRKAGANLPSTLIRQHYVPNESERETLERILELMGEPFGLQYDKAEDEWVPR
jgi:hypothetical protein